MEYEFAKRQKLDALAALIGGATAGPDGVLRISESDIASVQAAPVFPTVEPDPPVFPEFAVPAPPEPDPPRYNPRHAGLFSEEGGIKAWMKQNGLMLASEREAEKRQGAQVPEKSRD